MFLLPIHFPASSRCSSTASSLSAIPKTSRQSLVLHRDWGPYSIHRQAQAALRSCRATTLDCRRRRANSMHNTTKNSTTVVRSAGTSSTTNRNIPPLRQLCECIILAMFHHHLICITRGVTDQQAQAITFFMRSAPSKAPLRFEVLCISSLIIFRRCLPTFSLRRISICPMLP